MPPPASRLYDLARSFLDVVVAHYLAQGVTLPERRYVCPGVPAWDCEQFTVWCESSGPHGGDPVAEQPDSQLESAGHALRYATLVVEVVRCVPTVNADNVDAEPPSADALEAAAELLYGDAILCPGAIVRAQRDGALPACSTLAVLSWQPLGPSGGLAGGALRVRVSLDAG